RTTLLALSLVAICAGAEPALRGADALRPVQEGGRSGRSVPGGPRGNETGRASVLSTLLRLLPGTALLVARIAAPRSRACSRARPCHRADAGSGDKTRSEGGCRRGQTGCTVCRGRSAGGLILGCADIAASPIRRPRARGNAAPRRELGGAACSVRRCLG